MEFNYNKCPECGYVNNNQPDVCPSCGCDLAKYRDDLYAQEQAEIKRQREEVELAEKEAKYLAALQFFTSNEYQEATIVFLSLGDYKESVSYAKKSEKAFFDSTVVKEFSKNPFISALYSDDAQRKENVSDAVLEECISDPETIEELRGKFEKYIEKKHLPVEKYMVACTEALKELKRIQLILSEEAALRKRQEEEEAPLREKYEDGKEYLSSSFDDGLCFDDDDYPVHACYEEAIEIFEELGDYKDAPILLEQAKIKCLEYGKYLMQQHQYHDASWKFTALGNYENAPELWQEAHKLYVEIELPQKKERERVKKIKEEIAVLEKQMCQLTGLFAGNKKKSLQKEIEALKAQI